MRLISAHINYKIQTIIILCSKQFFFWKYTTNIYHVLIRFIYIIWLYMNLNSYNIIRMYE